MAFFYVLSTLPLTNTFPYKKPYEVWINGIFEDKRLVLRMVFSQCPTYNEKTGVETASLSLPVMLFQHSDASESRLVEMGGVHIPSH